MTNYALLRPEDLRLEEIESEQKGIVGHVTERTYKGMTLDSVIELTSMRVMVSEFFNEDDPDVDHSLGQKVRLLGLKAGRSFSMISKKLNLRTPSSHWSSVG